MVETEQEVIAFLSNGGSYGMPGAIVTRVETHCSIVFLVGNRAYKLKRQIAFSNLDYSTIDRRAAACRAELELNRRTAPELYLAVRAIRRGPDGQLGFDTEGHILDWVVEMCRFDQAELFDHLADANLLTPALLRALADEIAAFHRAAEETSEFGGAAGLRATIERNRDDQRTVEAVLGKDSVETLHEASLVALGRISDLLDQRRNEGKVRRCHGDLRLANICLFDGRPTLFDAIEFCDEISCIDVLFDLAFLLMDLHQRGLAFLSNIVFNRYFDATGNKDGLTAVPLMLSVRAANRAFTLAFAVQRQAEPEKARHVATTARTHLALALSSLGDFAPRMIAIGGLNSSGKSVLANALAADFAPAPGARVLRSDTVRKEILGLGLDARPPAAAYAPQVTARVYAALAAEAKRALAVGFSVIIEASFMQSTQHEAFAAIAGSASVPFIGLWLGAPEELALDQRPRIGEWHVIDPVRGPAASLADARSFLQLNSIIGETER